MTAARQSRIYLDPEELYEALTDYSRESVDAYLAATTGVLDALDCMLGNGAEAGGAALLMLADWYSALDTLSAAVSTGDEAAAEYINREAEAFCTRQIWTYRAIVRQHGGDPGPAVVDGHLFLSGMYTPVHVSQWLDPS